DQIQGVRWKSSFFLPKLARGTGDIDGVEWRSHRDGLSIGHGQTTEAEPSIRQDGVAEKPGRALVKLAKPSRIEPMEGVRPERLAQLLVDREAKIFITARQHQSYRLIGEPPVEQGQTVGLGIALGGLQENGPIAEEHGGGSINEALDACFITV